MMKKILSATLGAAMLATSFAPTPVSALTLPSAPATATPQTDVVQIREVRRIQRRGGVIYLNGHRGYRERHRGYREYNGFWFPAAAFLGGLIIGGVLDDGPRYVRPGYRLSNAHARWCYNRYRSYDEYSNTFQPYNGPRRSCYSPYR
jgi:BA14K-like protein